MPLTPEQKAEVNRLLTVSRGHHEMKKRHAGVIDSTGNVITPPNYPTAEHCILEALTARMDAHRLDPAHEASGWTQDTVPDAELIRFFVAYCRPLIPRPLMAQIVARFPDYKDIRYIP